MAIKVRLAEGQINPADLIAAEIQDAIDTEAPTTLSDFIIVGFGHNHTKGAFIIYDDGT